MLDSNQLSADDKPRFNAYMDLIAEVEKSLSTPLKSCSDPKPDFAADTGAGDPVSLSDPTNGYVAVDRDCAKILAAALACQLTSVVDFNIIPNLVVLHDYQHRGVEDKHSDYMLAYAKTFAYLWTLMDGLKDAANEMTVLDNSFSVFTNGDGLTGSFHGVGSGPHAMVNLPIATAGSLGGRLRTGYFLDYTLTDLALARTNQEFATLYMRWGRPYNNFPITIFTAFGLKPSDYETVPGQGYGEYDKGRLGGIPPELLTPEGRVAPLPFLLSA